jgi:Polysaccharide lyase
MRMAAFVFLATAVATSAAEDRGDSWAFKRSLNTRGHGYAVINDPTGTAPTRTIERFEVRAGDCGAEGGWSDCANDRERSELSQLPPRITGGERWYGWSIYFPNDYPNVWPVKTAIGQFHQTGAFPVWMVQHAPAGLYLDRHSSSGTQERFHLIDEARLRGQWHHIEMQVRWSRQTDGFLRVWVNGEQRVDYFGPTFHAAEVYFKYGVYRGFLSRARARPVGTQVVYFANVRAARAREGLTPAAR